MTLPKKGARLITVNGEQFVWKIRNKINWNEKTGISLQIPIQYVEGGQFLIVDSGYCRSDVRWAAYGIPNKRDIITPSFIEKCIRKGLKEGWKYKSEGKPFEISGEDLS